MCASVWVCAYDCGCLRSPEVSDPLQVDFDSINRYSSQLRIVKIRLYIGSIEPSQQLTIILTIILVFVRTAAASGQPRVKFHLS